MGKKGKLSADKSGDVFLYRAAIAEVLPQDEQAGLPLVLATEDPVTTFDINRAEIVEESLDLSGMEFPNQVPMVDTHERSSVRNVLGSIRNLAIDGGRLIGRAFFASDKEGQRIEGLYRDGHLTDFSVGARVLEAEYDGTNKTVTRSQLVEGSAVVAGHDPGAKALPVSVRAYRNPYELKEEQMNQKLRETLIARGLPEDATDEEAVAFVEGLGTESNTAVLDPPDDKTNNEPDLNSDGQNDGTGSETEGETGMNGNESGADVEAAVAAERSRVAGIDEICRSQNVGDEVRRGLIDSGVSVEAAALQLLKRNNAEQTGDDPVGRGPRISGGESAREKFLKAAETSVMSRAANTVGLNPAGFLNRVSSFEDNPYGHQYRDRDAVERNQSLKKELEARRNVAAEMRYASLPDIARMYLEHAGERIGHLPKAEIVSRAIRHPGLMVERSDAAFNTTGSFTNILLDAANKTLLAGYDEAPHTYTQWIRQAPSAPDFKALNRIRFGELADPEVVPENQPYPEKQTQDARESYNVEKHGEIFSISWEAIMNDDVNAFTRIPAMQGAAMRRKVNKVCYAVLTANAALSDGIALFHGSSHGGNLDANALAESALDTGFSVMSQQTGLSGAGTPLGIIPAFLVVPTALGATASRLVTGGVVATSVTNVPLYGAGRPRPIMVVEEPQLDANSTTAWYLAAASSTVETVEVTFLQGEESPVLSRHDAFDVDTIKYKIRQTFNAAAIDYRGLYQGNS